MNIRAAIAIAIGSLALTLSACGGSSDQESDLGKSPFGVPITTSASALQPISRVELMSKYAELSPLDKSATPETMDGLADSTCRSLRQGVSTDKLITVGTDIYKTSATEVIVLLVSYRCPEFLKDFK